MATLLIAPLAIGLGQLRLEPSHHVADSQAIVKDIVVVFPIVRLTLAHETVGGVDTP